MSVTTVFLVCAQTLFIQSISARCLGEDGAFDLFGIERCGFDDFAYDGFAYGAPFVTGACGFGPASLAASHGPGLAVTSASPLFPVGVSVLSENGYEGDLAVGGAVPFLGTVVVKGALPTIGAGAITYGCGNGVVNIIAEDLVAYGYADIAEPFSFNSLGFGTGFVGFAEPCYGAALPFGYRAGCGCGALY